MVNKELVRNLEQRKRDLAEIIQQARQKKIQVIKKTRKIWSDYNVGKISNSEYQKQLRKEFKGKNPQEWVDLYDDYIESCKKLFQECEEKIKKQRKFSLVKKLIISLIVLGLIIGGLFLYVYLENIPIAFAPEPQEFTQTLDITTTQDLDYELFLENSGPLQYLSLSGSFLSNGEAKVFLLDNSGNEFLILDTNNLNLLLSPDENLTQEKNTSQRKPETNITLPEQNITQETPEENITIPANITQPETNTTEEIPTNQTPEENITKPILINFSEICEQTCDLSGFNLTQESYILKIQTNTTLNLDELIYEILTELEIPEENITIPANETNVTIPEGINVHETRTQRGKRVIVSASKKAEEFEISTKIETKIKSTKAENIRIYYQEQNQYIDFETIDLDKDGFIDEISWTIPSINIDETQTFDIIVIIKAEHLDSSRNFISDIYDEVKALDDVWSETIPDQDYVRVTFEINLTSNRDITIYPRTISGTPTIEIYEKDQSTLIAEFTSINDNKYNKVFLTNLVSPSQDSFDLKILNGEVQFDHIIDPSILVGSASDNTDNTASVIVDVSGIGIQDDDLILFFGSADGTGYALPAGFTQLQNTPTGGSHQNILAYKIASSEPSSYTVNVASGTERGIAIFTVYRDVDINNPIDQSNSNIGGADLTGVITPITPTNDDSTVVVFVGLESGNAGSPIATSWPGSLVEQLDNVNGPPGGGAASSSGAFAHEIQTTAATVSGNIALTGGSTYWGVMAVVLNPGNYRPTTPTEIQCNGNTNCDITIDSSVTLEGLGSTDNEDDPINYYLEAYLNQGNCINDGSCEAILDSGICNDHSAAGCSWFAGGSSISNPLHFTGFETDNTSPYDGWICSSPDCLRSSTQTIVDDDGVSGGRYSIEVQDNSISSSTSQTFDLSNACEGSTCDQINLSVYLMPNSYDNTNEGFDIWCDYGRAGAVRIAHWQEDGDGCVIIGGVEVCENVWTQVEFDLIAEGCTIDSTTEIKFTSEDFTSGGNGDQVYIDGINLTGIIIGGTAECKGNLDCSVYPDAGSCSVSQCLWQITKQWTQIGSHAEGNNFIWDTSSIPDQTDVNLRARAIDLTGSNTYSNYYTKDPTSPYLEIAHGSNQPPSVSITSINSGSNVDLIPGSTTPVEIIFDVIDSGGQSTLDESTLLITFELGGESRTGTISDCSISDNGKTRTYTCDINMEFYDSAGTWTATVDINDTGGLSGQDTSTFQINLLRDLSLSAENMNFGTVNPGDSNIISSILTTITNNGNFDIPGNSKIQITSGQLCNPVGDECISGGDAITQIFQAADESDIDFCSAGDSDGIWLRQDLASDISGIILPKGLSSTRDIQFCFKDVPTVLTAEPYSTTNLNGQSWIIGVVSLLVAITPARRKRKKILDEKFLNFLDENLEDLLSYVKESKLKTKLQDIKIPLDIFKQKISPAEALCKYLKENKNLKFNEIAIAINRDQRTIWINYRNALKKSKEKLKIKSEITIPIKILSNRKLSILESIVRDLKQKGFTNKKIASLLGKSSSNIWTLHSRAEKKH